LGKALLLRAFRALRGRGRIFAGLTVDETNPTGAVLLYESVGMRRANRRLMYEKKLS
jgi:ribosomal protein S18 acetylase RimI-like enzyme